MEIGAAVDWVVGMPVIVLILAVVLWWILGSNDKEWCPNCKAPRIFGEKCINCGKISVDSTKN